MPGGLSRVDSYAKRCHERGDAEHTRSIRLHPIHPEKNLAMYVQRIEAAGWRSLAQDFSDDGPYRRCVMRFVRVSG
jgi:hypothetical protein